MLLLGLKCELSEVHLQLGHCNGITER